jgi:hypothetical protein
VQEAASDPPCQGEGRAAPLSGAIASLARTRGARLLALLPALVLAGCSAGVVNAQRQLEELHARGDYAQAAAFLEGESVVKAYEADRRGGKDTVLWELERGATALANDEPARAITLLNSAEERTRYNYERSAGEFLSSWVLNDTAPEYLTAAYEDQYVNVLKILAYLDLGQIDGKATAEARRFSDKARYLRDTFGRYFKAVNAEAKERYGSQEGSVRVGDERLRRYAAAAEPPEFIESPLGAYLSAISFLKTPGEAEAQRGAARRLLDAIEQQGALIGEVDRAAFESLPDLPPREVNVLAVAFSGRGPVKDKEQFGPIFLWYTTVNIVLPRLVVLPSQVTGAWLETSGGERFDLHLVEDMSRVAAENFERQMPGIYSRTMIRVVAKATAVGVATVATDESVGHNGHNDGGAAAAQIAVRALGFLYMALSEDADVRAWTMLPGQARVAHVKLPPGTHSVRVVYTTRAGTTIPMGWREINITADPFELTTLVEHVPD